MPNRTIHVISHTHWDREWYFSTCDSLVLMDHTITAILKELETNTKVNFCLDGQISIVEEYLSIHPEMKTVMEKLVSEQRLFVGPWYTQTDTQLVSMTSIINNLYHGIFDTKQLFGEYMNVGYLPDTFGFSNQLPMLLNQFNIDSFVFWRGVDYEQQQISPYFIWEGQDGSKVTAVNLPRGYAMAQGLNTGEIFRDNIFKPMIEELEQLTDVEDIMITVGGDQHTIVSDLDHKIKELPGELRISSYPEFVRSIENKVTDHYIGEFREGCLSRVHKSAGSIRSSIKESNYEAEQSLSKGLEPLNMMATKEGFGVSPHLITKAWKMLFEGQAHDGIVGCVSDSVAEDLLNRNKQALEISQAAQNLIKKQFAWGIGLKENEIILFNTEPHKFYGYKLIEIITHEAAVELENVESSILVETKMHKGYENALVETPNGKTYEKEEDYYFHKLLVKVSLPSMGYKVFSYHKAESTAKVLTTKNIENEYFNIEFKDGLLNLKVEGQTIENFISLVDSGNDGDTYDFSPLPDDKEFPLQMRNAIVTQNKELKKMVLDCTTELPYDLTDRFSKKNRISCPCTITIYLLENKQIKLTVDFENKVLSHRLRLKVKSYRGENQTIAATPGGTIVRNVMNGPAEPSWANTHVEYPIDIETNSGFVGFESEEEQLVIFNKGIKEYQAIGDSLYMTLFSTCSELGKPDLLYRPGRASGDTTKKGHIRMMTPLAQELHTHHAEFMITFMEPKVKDCYLMLQQFESNSIYYQLQNINLFYERIDNKIQIIDNEKVVLPKEKTYLEISKELYCYNVYQSLTDQENYLRFMCFEEQAQSKLFDYGVYIGDLAENKIGEDLKPLRIYTVKGDSL